MPFCPHLDHRREAGAQLQIRSGAVQHLDAALRHQRLLIVIHPHAMGEAEAVGREAGVGEIVDVLPAGARLDQRDLVAILRGVRMNHELMLDRETRHRFEQLARARHREPRREGGAQAAIRAAVPAPGDRHALVDRMRWCLRATAREQRCPNPSCTCRRPRAGPSARAPRTPRRCRARFPWSARWWCRTATARRRPAARRRRASADCARPPSARCASSASRAAPDHRHSRETGSGRDECASG